MSRFLKESRESVETSHGEIDFDDAIRLPGGGSTCDIYRTKWHRREVFVKRLKEEHRTNPLYLDALDKEYEIGVSLKHPSLPDYREFHRDYIVMDYIDGTTLSSLIKNKDPWLSRESNIVKLLKELVEVTGYLHRHNVTHCDIKADNIMITANNRDVILIDLDKCYTDSLNDTSGDPSKYGLSSDLQGRITIDFHAIGRIVEKLKEDVPNFTFKRYKEFVKECYSPNVTDQDLLEILDYKPGNPYKRYYWMITLAPFCVALLYGFVLWLTQGKGGYDDSYGADIPVEQPRDSLKSSPEEESAKTPETEITKEIAIEKNEKKNEEKREEKGKEGAVIVPEPLTQEQLNSIAQQMAVHLDKRINPFYDFLNAGIDSLVSFSERPGVTGEQLLQRMRQHGDKEDEYFEETYAILEEMYPGLSDRQIWRVLSYSKAYTGYKRRSAPILRELGLKIQFPPTSDP